MIVGSAEVTGSAIAEVGSTRTAEVTGTATMEVGSVRTATVEVWSVRTATVEVWSVRTATVEVGSTGTATGWTVGTATVEVGWRSAVATATWSVGSALFGAALRRRTAWPMTATATWATAFCPRGPALSRSRVGDSRLETDSSDAECAADRCCRDRMSDVHHLGLSHRAMPPTRYLT